MKTRKVLLTVAVAVYFLVVLVGLVGMAGLGPVFAAVALTGMALNGFMVGDWVGMIWKLDGQFDNGTDR